MTQRDGGRCNQASGFLVDISSADSASAVLAFVSAEAAISLHLRDWGAPHLDLRDGSFDL